MAIPTVLRSLYDYEHWVNQQLFDVVVFCRSSQLWRRGVPLPDATSATHL